jgi:hypothetical protein
MSDIHGEYEAHLSDGEISFSDSDELYVIGDVSECEANMSKA